MVVVKCKLVKLSLLIHRTLNHEQIKSAHLCVCVQLQQKCQKVTFVVQLGASSRRLATDLLFRFSSKVIKSLNNFLSVCASAVCCAVRHTQDIEESAVEHTHHHLGLVIIIHNYD